MNLNKLQEQQGYCQNRTGAGAIPALPPAAAAGRSRPHLYVEQISIHNGYTTDRLQIQRMIAANFRLRRGELSCGYTSLGKRSPR
jgi:hypothetical protein